MDMPTGEVSTTTAWFPERTPTNDHEKELIDLQTTADRLGMAAAEQVFLGELPTQNYDALRDHGRAAEAILTQAGLMPESSKFSSRYLYAGIHRTPGHPAELVYPVDSLHYAAYCEGTLESVMPILVPHPHPKRESIFGFRLCAVVRATRVMGLSFRNPEVFYAPVGEIYTQDLTYVQGAAEALEPSVPRR